MANEDDPWGKFQASISEPDEEVETDDEELEEDEADLDEDESKKDPKKSKKAAEGGEDDPDEEDSDEDESEDDDEADDEKSTYKPRLKQFFNKDGSLNAQRIEKSYIENSKETVRLNGEVEKISGQYTQLLEAIKSKPEIAKALFGEEAAKTLIKGKPGNQPPADPILAHVKAQMDNASKRDYNAFVEKHPEAVSDPAKAKKIGTFLKIYGQEYRESHDGELPTMKEGLEAAYRYYGWETKISKKEEVANAAKKTAATRRTPSTRKPATKAKKNELETFFAGKLGVKVR